MQNWIKKRNFIKRHAKVTDLPSGSAKRVKLTPWQVFMQDFGKTEGK